MPKTGSCLCGAVKYTLKSDPSEAGACHCSMCRKWSGGINIVVEAAPDQISFEGTDNITVFQSSEWGERCSCGVCGSSLYYRVIAPGPLHGTFFVGMGTLDDPSGITLTDEIFIDCKPKGYTFSGDLKGMTEAEFMALYGGDAPAEST